MQVNKKVMAKSLINKPTICKNEGDRPDLSYTDVFGSEPHQSSRSLYGGYPEMKKNERNAGRKKIPDSVKITCLIPKKHEVEFRKAVREFQKRTT